MKANDEAKLILEALTFLWPNREDIIAWADRRIAESVDPPDWIIDLATLNSPRLADYLSILTKNKPDYHFTTDEKVLMCLDSYQTGAADLDNTLAALSSLWLDEGLDPNLENVCLWWEQTDASDGSIGEDLEAAAHEAFDQFRQTHCDLHNPLPGLKTQIHRLAE